MIKIGIVMGSDSDLKVMSETADVLKELGISYEITIVSAHRTPDKLYIYANTARERGLKIIIAGAGGAAHLPGMVASLTTLPVIGVPIKTKTLNGLDSLYSIVQMPAGVPVASVAINGGRNAGILAAQILGCSDDSIGNKILDMKSAMQTSVENKCSKLELLGYEDYLQQI